MHLNAGIPGWRFATSVILDLVTNCEGAERAICKANRKQQGKSVHAERILKALHLWRGWWRLPVYDNRQAQLSLMAAAATASLCILASHVSTIVSTTMEP